jgi:sulfhydrogenase subunit beta (sulfur reductase)
MVLLDKKDFKKLLSAMRKLGTVKGPIAGKNGIVLGELSDTNGLLTGFANFKLPIKREFFPQCEVLSQYDDTGVVREIVSDEPGVLFGVRPCDAQALALVDKVFCDDRFVDPYYRKRRENLLVISLACATPEATCFCLSVKGGPASKTGTDILTFDIGKSLLLEPVSEKGETFLKKNKAIFKVATEKDIELAKKQETAARKQMNNVAVSEAHVALKKQNSPGLWEKISETCLSCGACTFLCPTCHCFDLCDEKAPGGGRKLRVHDACMFPSFVKEASGHNPRATKGQRMRQRVMHKFSYTQDNFDEVFCVGCGRCIINCPSNIDIRQTLAEVTR